MATFYNVCENELSVESCRKCSVKGSKIPVHVHLKAHIYIYMYWSLAYIITPRNIQVSCITGPSNPNGCKVHYIVGQSISIYVDIYIGIDSSPGFWPAWIVVWPCACDRVAWLISLKGFFCYLETRI